MEISFIHMQILVHLHVMLVDEYDQESPNTKFVRLVYHLAQSVGAILYG